MEKLRFASVGDNCVDRFRPPVAQSLIGGNAVNVAVQLARLGHQSHYFGAVGRDDDGRRTIELLAENGVNVEAVQQREIITAYTDIDVLPSGERVFLHEEFGACRGYRPSAAEIELLKGMDHVHFGWMDDGGALKRELIAHGVSVSQDISINATEADLAVDGLSIAFGSAGADDDAADAMLARLLGEGARLAVVTRGPKGATASDGVTSQSVGTSPIEVVDTTGAGDGFIAGFLAAKIGGDSFEQSLARGRDLGALTCTHVGGFPQAPRSL